VYDLGLDGLLLDDWLDALVHVVVRVFAFHGGSRRTRVVRIMRRRSVLELCSFIVEALAGLFMVAVFEFAVLHGGWVVGVLFGKDFAVLDWLDGGVVVILVDFAVDCFCDLFVADGLDFFAGYGSADGFVDSGVVVAMVEREF